MQSCEFIMPNWGYGKVKVRSDSGMFVKNWGDAKKNGRLRATAPWRGSIRVVVSAFFVLVLLVGGGCTPQSFETQDSLEKFSVYLDRHIPRLMDHYRVPGVSIALVLAVGNWCGPAPTGTLTLITSALWLLMRSVGRSRSPSR